MCVSPGFIKHNAFKMPGTRPLFRPSPSPLSLETGSDGARPQSADVAWALDQVYADHGQKRRLGFGVAPAPTSTLLGTP